MNTLFRMRNMLMLGLLATAALPARAQNAPPGAPNPAAAAKLDLATQAHLGYPGDVTGYMDVTYSVVRGYRPLKLDLYVPASGGARPAVVWIHGGGWAGGSPRAALWSIPGLARGAGEPGGPQLQWLVGATYRFSGEAKFPAAIEDIKASVRWLRTNAATIGVDPNRIGVWGESAGAQLASLLGTSCGAAELEGVKDPPVSSCVQAVADWYGPSDFSQMDSQLIPGGMKHDTPQSAESNYLGCQLSKCEPAKVQSANPIAYISANTPPFLIFHGTADTATGHRPSRARFCMTP